MLTKENKNIVNLTGFRKLTFGKAFLIFLIFFLVIDTTSYLFIKNDSAIILYIKALSFSMLAYSFVEFYKWNKIDKICFLFFLFFLFKLIIESLFSYGSILVHPTVLAVIFPFVYVLSIKNILKKTNVDILEIFCAALLFFYVVFMILYGRDFGFSNSTLVLDDGGPFSGDTRILHANSIYLIIIPYLFYLNKILKNATVIRIAGFVFSLLIILIHQHRTVWLTTIFSTFLFLSMKKDGKYFFKKVILIVVLFVVLVLLFFAFIPDLNKLFAERFNDILDPLNVDNTGGFRYIQILSYLEYFTQKPIFGWTFAGFDLPNPFTDNSWEEGTGQHFHDAYIEVLFYFGITGLLFKYYPLYRIAKKAFKVELSDNSKVLAAFCISGFLYSFSYVPPFVFWGILGMGLFYIEKDLTKYNKSQLNPKKI